ncbi:MAG TPA: arylformamidase [Caulobacteraceae bacterium]|jgi:arylformamidase|nr:arylformamidase [Caulobacteraceae bacterium]
MSTELRIWDISQALRPGLPVWPGDTPFANGRRWTQAGGSPVTVSYFSTTVHAGAHADAPLHYSPKGPSVAEVPLSPYLGPCRLIDARGEDGSISAPFVAHSVVDPPPRVLFRTYERFPVWDWKSEFVTVEAQAIRALAALGVRLIGIDSPSLDPQASKTMDAHHAVLAADMRVLEGLVLDDVPPGDYELIALPLKLEGLDASPVRAVLRELPK